MIGTAGHVEIIWFLPETRFHRTTGAFRVFFLLISVVVVVFIIIIVAIIVLIIYTLIVFGVRDVE